jgi:hypothetical protein
LLYIFGIKKRPIHRSPLQRGGHATKSCSSFPEGLRNRHRTTMSCGWQPPMSMKLVWTTSLAIDFLSTKHFSLSFISVANRYFLSMSCLALQLLEFLLPGKLLSRQSRLKEHEWIRRHRTSLGLIYVRYRYYLKSMKRHCFYPSIKT